MTTSNEWNRPWHASGLAVYDADGQLVLHTGITGNRTMTGEQLEKMATMAAAAVNDYGRDGSQQKIADLEGRLATQSKTASDLFDELVRVKEENARIVGMINSPQIADFLEAVKLEAIHQRERWGTDHDAGKENSDWFWLIGYLAGKAIRPDATPEKMLHHIITTAAACLNWHAARTGSDTRMRPGISE